MVAIHVKFEEVAIYEHSMMRMVSLILANKIDRMALQG